MCELRRDKSEFQVGDIVKGTVVKLEDKQVLVNIGYELEGIIPISELSSLHIEKPSDVVDNGESLTLEVKKVEDTDIILSKKAVDIAQAWPVLEKKFKAGTIFETEIKEVVKGGLVVDVGLRGFIPASLVEKHFVEDFSDYKNKILSVKIVEFDQQQNRLILSHRAVIEADEADEKQILLESLKVGQVIEGTVQRITTFGVFVDIGGVDGLVHISQLAHEHVENASDVVDIGEKIKVEILSVDLDNERISLSRKKTLQGPWAGIADRVQKGDILEGTIKRLVRFGAFVELFPNVEGLVHISEIAQRHIATAEEVLEVGQKVRVLVLDVNEVETRISISIKQLEAEQTAEIYKKYAKDTDSSGFQFGDIIGDQLDKYK